MYNCLCFNLYLVICFISCFFSVCGFLDLGILMIRLFGLVNFNWDELFLKFIVIGMIFIFFLLRGVVVLLILGVLFLNVLFVIIIIILYVLGFVFLELNIFLVFFRVLMILDFLGCM